MLARGASHAEIHDAVAKWLIASTLESTDGNVTRSAKILDVSRATLRRGRRRLVSLPGTPDAGALVIDDLVHDVRGQGLLEAPDKDRDEGAMPRVGSGNSGRLG
jgi:hypothetical protein